MALVRAFASAVIFLDLPIDFAFENGALALDFLRFNFGGLLVCLIVVTDLVLMPSPFFG